MTSHDRTEPQITPVFKSVDRFCQEEDMSRATFYREVKRGRIKLVKRGRRSLVHAAVQESYNRSLLDAS